MTLPTFAEADFLEFAAAMQAGDIARLRGHIDPSFTLTHITGYVQPGSEWLAEMGQGQFVYYRVRLHTLMATPGGDTARVVARTHTDARVYGQRNDWPLQLTMDYARRAGRWVALRAVASLWR